MRIGAGGAFVLIFLESQSLRQQELSLSQKKKN